MIKISFIYSFNSCLTLKNEFFEGGCVDFSSILKSIFDLRINSKFVNNQTEIMWKKLFLFINLLLKY